MITVKFTDHEIDMILSLIRRAIKNYPEITGTCKRMIEKIVKAESQEYLKDRDDIGNNRIR